LHASTILTSHKKFHVTYFYSTSFQQFLLSQKVDKLLCFLLGGSSSGVPLLRQCINSPSFLSANQVSFCKYTRHEQFKLNIKPRFCFHIWILFKAKHCAFSVCNSFIEATIFYSFSYNRIRCALLDIITTYTFIIVLLRY